MFLFLFSGLLKEWRSELQPWAMAVRLPNEHVSPHLIGTPISLARLPIPDPPFLRRSPLFNRKPTPPSYRGKGMSALRLGPSPLSSSLPRHLSLPLSISFHCFSPPPSLFSHFSSPVMIDDFRQHSTHGMLLSSVPLVLLESKIIVLRTSAGTCLSSNL